MRLYDASIVVSGISLMKRMASNNCRSGILSLVIGLGCRTKQTVNISRCFLFLRWFVPLSEGEGKNVGFGLSGMGLEVVLLKGVVEIEDVLARVAGEVELHGLDIPQAVCADDMTDADDIVEDAAAVDVGDDVEG